jgi:hypothetical protein
MLADGIPSDIGHMHTKIPFIPNPMIGKPLLPNFHIRTKLLLRPVRKSTFDELDRFFQASERREHDMNVVWHDDKLMQQISRTPVVIQRIDEQ